MYTMKLNDCMTVQIFQLLWPVAQLPFGLNGTEMHTLLCVIKCFK